MADDDDLADRIRDGMDSDHGGEIDGLRWEVANWRAGPGQWHRVDRGEPMWRDPDRVEYVTIQGPFGAHGEQEYRQYATIFTRDYDLAALVAEVMEDYGVAG